MGPFGWHRISSAEAFEIRKKLGDLEKLTWGEILLKRKHWNHQVAVSGICKAAQDRLEAIGYGDLEMIVSLRLSGAERVWGVLHEAVLTLLWWDPNHQVWPTAPKNT